MEFPESEALRASSQVSPEALASERAAAHVDGSTRPHICTEELNPQRHQLLLEFKKA